MATDLHNVLKGFKTVFNKAFQETPTLAPKLAMRVDSSNRSEDYRWLSAFPSLAEWRDEQRRTSSAQMNDFTISNKDFQTTIKVKRNDIEDDTIGVYAPLFAQLGAAARQHPDQLIFESLKNGFDQRGYDDVNFFSDNHKISGSGSAGQNDARYSNRSEKKLTATSYGSARAAMMSYLNEASRSARIAPSHLIVSPQLESVARAILKANIVESGSNNVSNVWNGSAELIVAPELGDDATKNYWFLADLTKPIKPFILQIRKEPELVALDRPDDHEAFLQKEYLYGVDYRGAVGYGAPQLIYGSRGSQS